MNQQCLGTTKTGSRCKNTRNLTDGYCRLHRPAELSTPKDRKQETSPRIDPPAGVSTVTDSSLVPTYKMIFGIVGFLILFTILFINRGKNSR